MTATTHRAIHTVETVEVRSVPPLRPFAWLGRGASDLLACAPANFGHSTTMVVLGWILLLMLGRHPYFVAAAVTGFLLVAPVMTTGLCELSRLRARGSTPDFDASLDILVREGNDLFRFGIVLAIAAALWFILSEAMLATVLDVPGPGIAETYYSGFLDHANRAEVISYVGMGAVLALVVFALSVVTVPLMIDRHVSAGVAMRASLKAMVRNPLAMIVWATLIVGLTAIGFATLLIGMILVIPLLGHATWHAYRELVN